MPLTVVSSVCVRERSDRPLDHPNFQRCVPAVTDPLIAATALALVTVLVTVVIGRAKAIIALFLGACVLAPWPLATETETVFHVGITRPSIEATTYLIAFVVAWLCFPKSQLRYPFGFGPTLAAGAYLGIGAMLLWEGTAAQWSGVLFLTILAASPMLGFRVADLASRDARVMSGWVYMLAGVAAIELFLCLVQAAGVPVSIYPEVHQFIAEGRAIGSFNHPSQWGKFALLITLVLLPLTSSKSGRLARVSWLAIIMAMLATGLTASRANSVAVIVAVGGWLVFSRTRRGAPGRRAVVLCTFSLAAVPAIVAGLDRLSIDPNGGDRSMLLEIGLQQIQSEPVVGTGPNSYVQEVGYWSSIVAQGFPVHNVFILLIAELGILGAVVFFIGPFLIMLAGLKGLAARDARRDWAMAFAVGLPGVLLITSTGWGLIAGSVGLFWFFVLGFLLHGFSQSSGDSGIATTSEVSPALRDGQLASRVRQSSPT